MLVLLHGFKFLGFGWRIFSGCLTGECTRVVREMPTALSAPGDMAGLDTCHLFNNGVEHLDQPAS